MPTEQEYIDYKLNKYIPKEVEMPSLPKALQELFTSMQKSRFDNFREAGLKAGFMEDQILFMWDWLANDN